MKPRKHNGEWHTRKWTCGQCSRTMKLAGKHSHERFCNNPSRFWAQVDKNGPNGCWIWTGYRDKNNYGDLSYMGKHIQAHRLSWKLLHGEPGRLDVLHKCNNPPCCNPGHLYAGTDWHNAQDRKAAGNLLQGENLGNAKLTNKDVLDLRRVRPKGVALKEWATKLGVAEATIEGVLQRRSWKHLP